MGRSILAVIAGYLVIAAGVIGLFAVAFGGDTDATPSLRFMLFSLGYGFAFAVLGGALRANQTSRDAGPVGRDAAPAA